MFSQDYVQCRALLILMRLHDYSLLFYWYRLRSTLTLLPLILLIHTHTLSNDSRSFCSNCYYSGYWSQKLKDSNDCERLTKVLRTTHGSGYYSGCWFSNGRNWVTTKNLLTRTAPVAEVVTSRLGLVTVAITLPWISV
jgi:hypothetical protein